MRRLLVASAGLAIGGPAMALLLVGVDAGFSLVRAPRRSAPTPFRSVLVVVLVELRSGNSILAALQRASEAFPEHSELVRLSRVAAVDGLERAAQGASKEIRRLAVQLARAQRSGSSVAVAVRGLLEWDIARDRTERLARAKALPVRLMIPIALLLLPGLMLMFYAPVLISLVDDISGPFT